MLFRHPQRDALTRQQQQLRVRSAELRVTLAHQSQVLQAPLAVADQVRAGAQWLRQHPQWPIGALALLAFKRPRRVLRWSSRLLWGWRVYLRARDWMGSATARSPRS